MPRLPTEPRVPLFVEVAGRGVLCVGGGAVAARKLRPLQAAGAVVTVIAPRIVAPEGVSWIEREYRPGDVAGAGPWLVVAATGVGAVDAAVAAEAEDCGVWCVAAAGHGSAALPSVARAGPVTLALTTGAPALAAALAERLVPEVAAWAPLADVLTRLRTDPEVAAALAALPPAERRQRWRATAAHALEVAAPDIEALRGLLLRPLRRPGP